MSDVDTVLGRTATAIKSALGRAVEISPAEGALVLRFPRFESAIVTLRINDPTRPSFEVTYPCLKSHHSSLSQAQDVHASGPVLEGVLWIVRAVAEHGVVLPEFPHAHVLRQLDRARDR